MSTSQPAYSMTPIEPEERDRLLLEHLPQVQYIARRIHDRLPSHVPLADLVQAGILGLIDALSKYDANRNVQFKSYAAFRIRGAILDSLRDLDWGPRDLRRRAREVQEVTNRLELRLSRVPGEQEIAHDMGMELEEFQRLLGELRGLDLGSLEPEGSEGEPSTRDVPANPEHSPFSYCLREEVKSVLAGAISNLPEKEQKVLALYYYEELTMKDIGAVLGVGESRVSQIHSLALVRLRGRLEGAFPHRVKSKVAENHG
jgi:RNA polymerase sigma factor FliA